ncbi:MAG TPA: P-II family nitrogen regulator [Treponemataceae bacterium]|jgi:nitrogen regulatory protein PII|nr:P-II family nitrogen regulator [Treponemataceae bacterium]HQL04305.1 P-II family nitrogen regulator [Treponemataceae bacterium]
MKILTAIVPHNQGELIAEAARKAGAAGATIQQGRGTAHNQILQLLGLGDSEKDIVFIVVPLASYPAIEKAIVDKSKLAKPHYGILFSRHVHYFLKNTDVIFDQQIEEADSMKNTNTHELITIIVNAGFADDAMEAARKAGASGGTILNGRGTGRAEDVSFFGITIVPEKEVLLILVEKGKSPAILEAVKTLESLTGPGTGIAYCTEVSDFVQLGKDTK